MGGGGGWETEDRLKAPFGLKEQYFTFSEWHKLIKSTREAQTAMRSSLVPHVVLLMRPRTINCTLVV